MSTREEVDAFVSFLHRTFIEKGVTKADGTVACTATLSTHERPGPGLMPRELAEKISETTLVSHQGPPSRG